MPNPAIDILVREIWDTIQAVSQTHELTRVEVIGALEVVKAQEISLLFDDNAEDGS